ncbi:MAG: hypothetical protein ACXWQO_01165 [Bdellovibrionota bacterium]
MNTLFLLLAASLAFGHGKGQQLPELKSPEELKEACTKLGQEANRVIAPPASKSCASFMSGSLEGSRAELKKEFEGNSGVVHYCNELTQKLQDLRKYRAGVEAGCNTAGAAVAKASAQTKSSNQDKLMGVVGDAREQIANQQASCAGALAPIVHESNPDNMIRAGTVAEPAPANAPKDNYAKLNQDVVKRQTQFINSTAKNGGAAAYAGEKDQCGKQASEYIELAKHTRRSFDQMSSLVGLEEDHTIAELEKFREKASTAMNNGKRVKVTLDQLAGPMKAPSLYNNNEDEPVGTAPIPEHKPTPKYNQGDD